MELQTGYKLGKEHVKAVCCHPAYLTSMRSTSCEMSGWKKHKLESRGTGKPGVQLALGLQRVRHDRATELNIGVHVSF